MTWAYLFKNGKAKQFFVFAALVFIPCSIIAYYFPLSKFINWMFDFRQHTATSWASLSIHNYALSIKGYILVAFAFVYFIFAESAVSTLISRHLRVGRFTAKGIFLGANENFFPAMFASIGFVIMLLLTHAVIALFLFLWLLIKVKTLGLILSIISVIAIGILFTYIWATTNLWIPVMSFNGLNMLKSLSVAFYKSRSSQKKFFVPYLFIVCLVVTFAIISYYTRKIWIVSYIITIASYIFATVFIISFSFISYFKVESIHREDLAYLYKSK